MAPPSRKRFYAHHPFHSVVPHPSYSPDCYFFLFTRIKMKLKGRRFDIADIIKINMTRELNSLSCEEFQRCFQK
jgi:hypothetical protein